MLRLAITAGDPSGIGPEIVLKSLREAPELMDQAKWIVIGPSTWSASLPKHANIIFIDPGKGLIHDGERSYAYVEKAVSMAINGEVRGIVTAPISKGSWVNAKKPFTGHTEMLAALSKSKRYAMAFSSPRLNILLATIHAPLLRVPSLITPELLFEKIQLADEFGKLLGYPQPRIGVAGLNPHAGESGHLGDEETRMIHPSIIEAQQDGILASGPFPADTLFHQAVNEQRFDIILAMYHDQALAPLKLIAFHEAVNVTVGLPFIRTSPDHGTAFDIAGKNMANPSSMIAAMRLAIKMATDL
jgi:4-hydroxythreonine-4-phosphate dehydrogenase